MMATTISPFGDHLCFISPCRFDHLRQRHQALANCFAETGTRVTYVNPIGSAGFSLRRQRFGESLQIFDLTVPFRATQHPGLQRITCLAAKRLLQLHGEWSPRNSHLWLADPAWCSWTTAPWQKIYYDRCDRHGFFPRQCREAWLHYELSLYKLSHIIFCTSKVLQNDIPLPFRHKAVLVANASSSTAIRSPRPSGPPWQIVSAGAHYEWIDIPWLERLAAHPQVRLHIAGPGRGTGFRNLLSLSGVTYHGVLSQSQLNALFQRCHTGVIPFVDSELTRAVDPIKAYEYAAAGLRVWASPVPGLDTHPCVTDIISDQVSFMQAIDRLPLPIPQRSVPTWADRAREVLERLTVTRPGESR